MDIKIKALAWNNLNIDIISKETLQNFKLNCVFNFVFSFLVFCLGLSWLSIGLYGTINYNRGTVLSNYYLIISNYLILTTFLVNVIPTSIGLSIFIRCKKIPNWNISKLFIDLTMCQFILQFFSLFGGIVCNILILKKINKLFNYPIVIEDKKIVCKNFNNFSNQIISPFKYTYISEPSTLFKIKLIKNIPKTKTLEIHIFTLKDFIKLNVEMPTLYYSWSKLSPTNLIPIVNHIYIDPQSKILKINYLAEKKTCFFNNSNFYESIIVLPFE